MREYPARRDPRRPPTHPGFLLRGIIEEQRFQRSRIAEALGVSQREFRDILNGRRPLSPPLAARLGDLFGNGAGLWIRMQEAHDAWRTKRPVHAPKVERR